MPQPDPGADDAPFMVPGPGPTGHIFTVPDPRARHPYWTRWKGETRQAFQAFTAYLDAGMGRSNAKVARGLGKSTTIINRWSSRWYWVRRAEAYDAMLEQERVDAQVAEVRRMGEVQAQRAAAILDVALRPAAVLIQKWADNPPDLNGMDEADLMEMVYKAARILKPVVEVERLARGEPPAPDHPLDGARMIYVDQRRVNVSTAYAKFLAMADDLDDD